MRVGNDRPLRCAVSSPIEIAAADASGKAAKSVYVAVGGTLVDCPTEGKIVQAGQMLARIENLELERQSIQLAGEGRELEQHLENLRLQANQSQLLRAEIPTAEAALLDVRQRIDSLQHRYRSAHHSIARRDHSCRTLSNRSSRR